MGNAHVSLELHFMLRCWNNQHRCPDLGTLLQLDNTSCAGQHKSTGSVIVNRHLFCHFWTPHCIISIDTGQPFCLPLMSSPLCICTSALICGMSFLLLRVIVRRLVILFVIITPITS